MTITRIDSSIIMCINSIRQLSLYQKSVVHIPCDTIFTNFSTPLSFAHNSSILSIAKPYFFCLLTILIDKCARKMK